ncbi:ankyrin-2-like [Brachypodium distachyon]|uniref:PGG domain-containing protein n=1 Tax=Brachypodium distachyon TaxID=15368 RepID=A0A0Q3I6J6_BRADI|nr:ankyrin-2-like [Brachypodium distachyon]KQJ81688.1 hypothetical protein BRADI_5g02312v3 [Brachypodium distachyon]|eukprot:XP_024311242.1 ankyrin-2-like [Brachypodium distachyon]
MDNNQRQPESYTITVREGDTPGPSEVIISIFEGQISFHHAGRGNIIPPNDMVRETDDPPQRQEMQVALLKAAVEGDRKELERILQEELDQQVEAEKRAPEPRQEEEIRTPPRTSMLLQGVTSDLDGVLHIAARLGHVELVKKIAMWPGLVIDVEAKNRRGETPLHCAAATGNVAMIGLVMSIACREQRAKQLLREKKCDGETCLHEAVRSGNKLAVETLVEEDVNVFERGDPCVLVGMEDNEGVSPLYLATTLRQLDIVQFLTQKQRRLSYPDASYKGPGEKTALHAAVLLGKDLSKCLVQWKKGRLVSMADESWNTPLHLLASTEDTSIAKLLLKADECAGYHADKEGSLPIHVAAANGSLTIVELLAKKRPGCALACNNLGQTILHIAVQKRRYDVVNYVCSKHKLAGILNVRDSSGNTALHLAVEQGNQFIFCRLMRCPEVCLSFTNKEARTPLDIAQLKLPLGLSLSPAPRQWIMYHLVLAGGDYGTCRRDQFATVLAKPDREKESKSTGKSAGLVAVCAVLILTIAFAAPFTVTRMYSRSEDSAEYESLAWAIAYRIFMASDAFAFAFSAVATSCCTYAGFSFMDRRTRLFYLTTGGVSLRLAAVSIIVVFSSGVYVAVAPVDYLIPIAVCPFAALVIIPQLTPVFVMLLHAWSLLMRIGFLAWCRTMFCWLPRPSRYRVPGRYRGLRGSSLAVLFCVFLVCYLIFVCAFLSARNIIKGF